MLAVNFDQCCAERAQSLHAHRLVVDESAGAAVGELNAPHDQFGGARTVAGQTMFRKHFAHRMVFADFEGGCDLTLFGALAHQRRLAAGAERKRECIEQDRLAGPGLASEHSKAAAEVDVQPIDKNDVADGQSGQHETGSMTPKNGKADHTRFLFCRLCRGVRRLCQPKPLNARLIHEPLFSVGSPPADFTSL